MTQVSFLLLAVCMTTLSLCASEGEFKAGSFVLTQKALDEAPYRYAGVLREALDKLETMDLPHMEDWQCTGYKIFSAGRRSSFKIVQDSLSLKLFPDNTVTIAAKVDAVVTAKVWVRNGYRIGFLDICLVKFTICNGAIATMSTRADIKIVFKVIWDSTIKRLSVKTKTASADFSRPDKSGCRPSWFVQVFDWFDRWKNTFEEKVEKEMENAARAFEDQSLLPQEFSPFKDVFIKYSIVGLIWSTDHVIFQAATSFSATSEGRNQTFKPNIASTDDFIPMQGWNMSSPAVSHSHLLQGIRLSSQFLNALMWYANVTGITEYHGQMEILDTAIESTISYDPPEVNVQDHNLLGINIKKGLVLALCKPLANATSNSSILIKAEFIDLLGSGKVNLLPDVSFTGIHVSLDDMDLGKLSAKLSEPKLPLPESVEKALLKNAMVKLQPVVNSYLKSKPLVLPEKVAPFVSNPELNLWSVRNGAGYAEVLSYCTCSEINNATSTFAMCDARSLICDANAGETSTVASTTASVVVGISAGHIDKVTLAEGIIMDVHNFTEMFEHQMQSISVFGTHMTTFEQDDNCRLDDIGSTAKVYWLWIMHQCAPLFVNGTFMEQYYYMDKDVLHFMCSDISCLICEFHNLTTTESTCHEAANGQSFIFEDRNILGWKTTNRTFVMANVFFYDTKECDYQSQYSESQLISSHTNLGPKSTNDSCIRTRNDDYIALDIENETVLSAQWECSDGCNDCSFILSNKMMSSCIEDASGRFVILTNSIEEEPLDSFDTYKIVLGCFAFLFAIAVFALVIWQKKRANLLPERTISKLKETSSYFQVVSANIINYTRKIRVQIMKHFGNRLLTWKNESLAEMAEDILQNVLLLVDGIMAVVFAVEWDGENNPLLIIRHKLSSGVSISVDIFDTDQVDVFVNKLNVWISSVCIANAVLAFSTVTVWCVTVTGTRNSWTKIRLLLAASFLPGIFVVIVSMILSTFFGELVLMQKDQGLLITDNEDMFDVATTAIQATLNGLSLTIISFTVAFLFHSVGGGLFCGMVVFRIVHLRSKNVNMEILAAPLVILTIVQPFVCLHPVIIWSQECSNKLSFLLLIILLWFLPLLAHVFRKTIIAIFKHFCRSNNADQNLLEEDDQSFNPVDVRARLEEEKERNRKYCINLVLELIPEILQLIIFLVAFSAITKGIIDTEFDQDRSNLKAFVLPTVVSVFCWMASTSYMILSLVMENRILDKKKRTNLISSKRVFMRSLKSRLTSALGGKRSSSRINILWRKKSDSEDQVKPETADDTANTSIAESYAIPEEDFSEPLEVVEEEAIQNGISTISVKEHVDHFEKIKLQPIMSCATCGQLKSILRQRADMKNVDNNEVTDLILDGKNDNSYSCCGKIQSFLESREYKDPKTFGWRIKFRRIFLLVGVILVTFVTSHVTVTSQTFSSKEYIHKLLAMVGTNLTWPDGDSALDDVFNLYNSIQVFKSYVMIFSCLTFWTSLIFDIASLCTTVTSRKSTYCMCSRMANFLGSLAIFAGVIVVGLPDYLAATGLDKIVPFCGETFNATVKRVAEFGIGLILACFFTSQIFPILLMIVPSLVRASVLVLIHPALQKDAGDLKSEEDRMLIVSILRHVVRVSSMMAFPITFISLAIVQQVQKDATVTLLILAFWFLPPIVLLLGLYLSERFSGRNNLILLYVYYVYNVCYLVPLVALFFYSIALQKLLSLLEYLMRDPTFATGFVAEVFLGTVVISDMLYVTVL